MVLTAVYVGSNGTIDHMVGGIASGNSVVVSPTTTTFYALTVEDGNGGTITNFLTVWVNSVMSFGQYPSGAVTSSGPMTFTVWPYGSGTVTHQWYKDGVALDGETGSTMSATLAGTYFLRITSSMRGLTKSIDSESITLNANSVGISSQPGSATVNAGVSHTFSITATGAGTLSYQWYRDGSAVSGATGSTLTTGTAGNYKVTVTSTLNGLPVTVDSDEVTLSVNSVSISAQPEPSTLAGGSNTFSVTASGSGTLTYQWYRDGSAVSGATGSTHTTSVTGTYAVRVTSTLNGVSAWVDSTSAGFEHNSVSISSQPTGATVVSGGSHTFSVTASGSGALTYQWYRDGSAISGATGGELVATTAGSYVVRVTSTLNATTNHVDSVSAGLSVNSVSVSTQPTGSSVLLGGHHTLSVGATGTGTRSLQWYLDGSAISGATGSTYVAYAAGTYRVRVTSTLDGTTTYVDSNNAVISFYAVTISSVSPDTYVTQGQTRTISATMSTPGGLAVSYQWQRDDSDIAGATNVTYPAGVSGSYRLVVTSSRNGSTMVQTTDPIVVTAVAPTSITSFDASVSNIAPGGSTSLVPVFSGGAGVITPGNIVVNSGDSITVSPSVTTVYTLTVTNLAGSSSARTYEILVTTGSFTNAVNESSISRGLYSTAVSLADGRVLVLGNQNGTTVTDIFDPVTDSFTRTGDLAVGRRNSPALLLSNGRVLVTGGMIPGAPSFIELSSAELYDPATGTWSSAGSMSVARVGHYMVQLPNGLVLVGGGNSNTIEFFDPATGLFSPGTSMPESRSDAHAALLPDGNVIVIGGYAGTGTGSLTTAIIYDVATATWSGLSSHMSFAHANGSAMAVLDDGRIIIAGGFDSGNVATSATDIFDPATNTFTSGPPLTERRAEFGAVTLMDGKVIFIGGLDGLGDFTDTVDVFDPSTNRIIRQARTMSYERYSVVAALMGDGRVFISGRVTAAELFSE